MSYSTAAVLGGCASLGYGLYSTFTAKGTSEEIAKQKKTALLAMAIGVGAIAIGIAGLHYSAVTEQIPAPAGPPSKALTTCDVQVLNRILEKGGENTLSQKVFKSFNETQGITCDNFLAWQDKFHEGGTGYIDGVRVADLPKSAMWGVDQFGRPFMSLKYTCAREVDKVKEAAVTLFQRYSDTANVTSTGGHGEAACFYALGRELLNHPNHTEFAAKVRDFLAGRFIITTGGNVLSLAK